MIQLVVQDNVSSQVKDISALVVAVTWETAVEDQPGKLTFQYQHVPGVDLNEGSVIMLKVNGTGVFYGYVFKRGVREDLMITITAYDQLRYLKNKDTRVIKSLTASQLFEQLCKELNLQHRVVEASTYVIASLIQDNKAYYEMISRAITDTLINSANWYVIYDNFGVIEFNNLNNLKTPIYLGPATSITSYTYESEIDSDTYNQIKLIREDTEAGKREVYIAKDSSNIAKWGSLQYFEKVDAGANSAQIRERAEGLLKAKNRVTKSLSLVAVGDLRIRAGSGVILDLPDLDGFGFQGKRYYMVTECQHSFQNEAHAMHLKVRLV